MYAKKTVLLTSVAAFSVAALTACSSADGSSSGDQTADGYSPGERITMTVPFSAGGGSDLAGRATAGGCATVAPALRGDGR